MTGVEFHFNAPDKQGYAVRLLRKAYAKGSKVVVTAPLEQLGALDRELWAYDNVQFLPHCVAGEAAAAVVEATPIVLAGSVRDAPHSEVLVNLGDAVPDGFERFERLIEVVSQGDADRQVARGRWKHYADRGYAIKRVDLVLKGA